MFFWINYDFYIKAISNSTYSGLYLNRPIYICDPNEGPGESIDGNQRVLVESDISEIYGKLKPNVLFTLYPDEEGKLTTSDIVDNAYSNDTYEVVFIQAEDKLGNAVDYYIEDNII